MGIMSILAGAILFLWGHDHIRNNATRDRMAAARIRLNENEAGYADWFVEFHDSLYDLSLDELVIKRNRLISGIHATVTKTYNICQDTPDGIVFEDGATDAALTDMVKCAIIDRFVSLLEQDKVPTYKRI